MYKAIPTTVVSVEPGKVTAADKGMVSVESEALRLVDAPMRDSNCVVVSLESGPNGTITDHVLNHDNARQLFVGLLGAMGVAGDPMAIAIAHFLSASQPDE